MRRTAALEEPDRIDALEAVMRQLPPHPQLHALCLHQALALPGASPERIRLCGLLLRQEPSLLTYDLWLDLLSREV